MSGLNRSQSFEHLVAQLFGRRLLARPRHDLCQCPRDESLVAAARAVLEMLGEEIPLRFLGYPEKLAVRINGIAPLLLDRAFVKHRRSLPALPQERLDGAPAQTDSSTVNP